MRQTIFSRDTTKQKQGSPSDEWKVLPCLCCQAAGGDYAWAEDICAAWFLFHNAARLMDNVEDHENSKNNLSIELSLNAATGLFFTAQYALNKLSKNPKTHHAAEDIYQIFISKLLKMSEGQNLDILHKSLNLELYWQVAEKKSGSFFSLATYSGARLATTDHQILDGFDQYGSHLGLLIQLLDDLEDVYTWMHSSIKPLNLNSCLPFVYLYEVAKDNEKRQLNQYLLECSNNDANKKNIISLLDRNGAVLYLLAEIERHSGLAMDGLKKANAMPPALDKLKEIITTLTRSF